MTKSLPKKIDDPSLRRPDVFDHYDYRAFLKEWVAYLKATLRGFSLRSLSTDAGLSAGYLPLVLSRQRNLTAESAAKLAGKLHLSAPEQLHFDNLVRLAAREDIDQQVRAIGRMKRSRTYKARNPAEVEFFEYMSRWYHIAIRELANLDGFRADAEWVRDRLRIKLPLAQIQAALDFLVANGFLVADASGQMRASKELLRCEDAVYSKTLRFYHKQMLSLAEQSMTNAVTAERQLFGYTLSLPSAKFDEARAIMDRAVRELEALEKRETSGRDSVYHLELAFFPITKTGST